MQPSTEVLLALLEPIEEPVEPWVLMPEVPGLVVWLDCPDMLPVEPELWPDIEPVLPEL